MLGAPNVVGALHLGLWVCLVVFVTNAGGAMHLGFWVCLVVFVTNAGGAMHLDRGDHF